MARFAREAAEVLAVTNPIPRPALAFLTCDGESYPDGEPVVLVAYLPHAAGRSVIVELMRGSTLLPVPTMPVAIHGLGRLELSGLPVGEYKAWIDGQPQTSGIRFSVCKAEPEMAAPDGATNRPSPMATPVPVDVGPPLELPAAQEACVVETVDLGAGLSLVLAGAWCHAPRADGGTRVVPWEGRGLVLAPELAVTLKVPRAVQSGQRFELLIEAPWVTGSAAAWVVVRDWRLTSLDTLAQQLRRSLETCVEEARGWIGGAPRRPPRAGARHAAGIAAILRYRDERGAPCEAKVERATALVIGRSRTAAQLTYDDSSVASMHARVRWAGDLLVIEDCPNAETLLNGHRVARAELLDGDVISCGRLELTVALVPDQREPHPELDEWEYDPDLVIERLAFWPESLRIAAIEPLVAGRVALSLRSTERDCDYAVEVFVADGCRAGSARALVRVSAPPP